MSFRLSPDANLKLSFINYFFEDVQNSSVSGPIERESLVLFKRKQLVRQCSLIQRNTFKALSMYYCWPPYSSAMPQAFSSVLWKRNVYRDVHISLQTFLCETTRFFAFNCQNPGKSFLVQGNPDFTVQACTDMGHKQLWLSLSLTFWNNWCTTILVILDEI